jgi:hypothetical protein
VPAAATIIDTRLQEVAPEDDKPHDEAPQHRQQR